MDDGVVQRDHGNHANHWRPEFNSHLTQEVTFPNSFPIVSAMPYFYLVIAIVSEVIGTSFMKASEGFTKPMPTLIMAAAYAVAFYFLSLTLRTIPVGIAYAIWSGVGIVLIAAVSWLVLGQKLDGPAIIGMGLIATGVVVMNLFSKSVAH